MWDLIVSVPDHCLSFYFAVLDLASTGIILSSQRTTNGLIGLRGCSD